MQERTSHFDCLPENDKLLVQERALLQKGWFRNFITEKNKCKFFIISDAGQYMIEERILENKELSMIPKKKYTSFGGCQKC